MKTPRGNPVPFALKLAALGLSLFFIQQGRAASWVTNGPLLTARDNHTATLLPNGKVLVAGGWNGSYLSSAELYDPATGKWTATGSMITNHCYHTATLLPNGRVLVAGGYANESAYPFSVAGAELYDPTTGTWTNTGSMVGTHVYHTATLLPNGKVLVTGGAGADTELYDPASGTWTNTGSMNRARWYHTATLLTNGNVLVAGGDYNYLPPGIFPTAEIYNPLTGIWTSTSAMTTNRTSPTATLLPNGLVLVAGGWLMAQVQTNPPAYSSFSLNSGELYDPVTGNWTATTNTMTVGRNDHTASLLPNGQVLMAAGFQGGPGDRDSMELFDSAMSAWIPVTNKLNNARSHHTATILPSGRILVVGGFSHNDVSNSTEVYDWANGSWTNTGVMNTARENHTATLLPNGEALVAGGYDGSNLSDVELFDPSTGVWRATNSLNTARRLHTATLLPDGRVLVTGGTGNGAILSSAELYDPASGTWSATNAMNSPRSQHTATLMLNGKVLVAGGTGGVSSAELFDPATGTWTPTGTLNTGRGGHMATLLPNGKVLVAGGTMIIISGIYGIIVTFSSAELYDSSSGSWTETGAMTTARQFFTGTLLPSGKVLAAGGYDGGLGPLSTAELYDPVSGSWTATGGMTAARAEHTATLLPNGKVLVAGGFIGISFVSSMELFDPAAGYWRATGTLITARGDFTSNFLPNGKVLLAGGQGSGFNPLSSAELYDVGLVFSNSWQPQIATATSPLNLGSSLEITGSKFRGISGASGGNTQDSSSDYPLVQLRSIESGQTTFLLTTNWSTNSFTSLPVWNFPPGWALATVFVNGIPSTSSIVNVSVPIPTATLLTGATKQTNGSFQFTFTNSVGAVCGVQATTNASLPMSNWTALGGVTEISPGQFQFIDPQATNFGQRFYRLRSP